MSNLEVRELDNQDWAIIRTLGDMFVRSAEYGYNSEQIIDRFLTSKTAELFQIECGHLQYLGDAYMLSEFLDELKDIPQDNDTYDDDTLEWIGCILGYWNIALGTPYKVIAEVVTADRMARTYAGYHTQSMLLAIEWYLEKYEANK